MFLKNRNKLFENPIYLKTNYERYVTFEVWSYSVWLFTNQEILGKENGWYWGDIWIFFIIIHTTLL